MVLDYLTKTTGVLGMNARNQKYIRPSGFKRAVRIIDNKLRTKRILKRAGIPTPGTIAIIRSRRDLYAFDWGTLAPGFTLKPNRGHGGEGILIVYGRKKGEERSWVKADRSRVTSKDLEAHILNILDGYYSLSNLPDIAFFEERVKNVRQLKPYTYKGVPDVRIIVYNKVPVMAQLRLPTRETDGKANLHLGAIGVGIDIAKGETTNAIHHDKLIVYVPGTRLLLRGMHIPHWNRVLELAAESQIATEIGFLGVDIAIDREKGPLVLELNTRPGLSIQLANLAPLRDRLERVRGLRIKTAKRGVRVARELFGEEEEELPEKLILGVNEKIVLVGPEGIRHETIAKMDTGAYRTSIARDLAETLGTREVLRYKTVKSSFGKEERPIIELSFILAGKTISTEAFIADRGDMKRDVIMGRRDLKDFLVDPSKNILLGR